MNDLKADIKNLVFISHATPEDNCFTLWLSTRLKLLGYEVWSDVTQLFGGEKWWEDIEEAIDRYSCKFILVITRTSLSKPGVKKEIQLALAAETKHNHRNYIIPLIIDDSDFSNQPYSLSERNIISFTSGWAIALEKLIERLNRDGVSTNTNIGDLSISLQQKTKQKYQLKNESDLVLSNWLEVLSLPETLSFYRIPINSKDFKKHFICFPYPWFVWGEMFVTFADRPKIESILSFGMIAKTAPTLNLQSVINNEPRNHEPFSRSEVMKKMNYMISEAWNIHMQKIGLHTYTMSSGRLAWFFPDEDQFSGLLSFHDLFGVEKKRKITGYSSKNKVFWHFALEVKVQFGKFPKICLIPHVVFTEDGHKPLSDNKKMHRLRRGFCKMWWNDRWRDMLLLYLSILSKEQLTIELPVGNGHAITINARPTIFSSPLSLQSHDEDDNLDGDIEDVEVGMEGDGNEP